jgi:plasmid stabilization system protein ParE
MLRWMFMRGSPGSRGAIELHGPSRGAGSLFAQRAGELKRAFTSLDALSPDAAIAAVDAIRSAIEMLEHHPLIGRIVEGSLRELVISFGRSGYLALYRLYQRAARSGSSPFVTSASSTIHSESEAVHAGRVRRDLEHDLARLFGWLPEFELYRFAGEFREHEELAAETLDVALQRAQQNIRAALRL